MAPYSDAWLADNVLTCSTVAGMHSTDKWQKHGGFVLGHSSIASARRGVASRRGIEDGASLRRLRRSSDRGDGRQGKENSPARGGSSVSGNVHEKYGVGMQGCGK